MEPSSMSTARISRSPDLLQLRMEGYEVRVSNAGLLEVGNVPFVRSDRTISRGTIVSELNLQGDRTGPPGHHTVWFVGGVPCDAKGQQLDHVININSPVATDKGQVSGVQFSSKPDTPYPSYYAKLTLYINMIQGPAQRIAPTDTAQTYREIVDDDDCSVFKYIDTGPGRSGIANLTETLNIPKVAIVGLGGTGSYVLDLIAKTPIREIHLFDGDVLYSHNAFRAPGAASLDLLRSSPKKVVYYQSVYENMRVGVVPHDCYITEGNVDELMGMEFVFLCVDGDADKPAIVRALEQYGTSFIDVGMDVQQVGDQLTGVMRTSASVPERRKHIWERGGLDPIPGDKDLYDRDIQIADLNALNASLAVIKWKKMAGLYVDLAREHTSVYCLNGNYLVNEDQHR